MFFHGFDCAGQIITRPAGKDRCSHDIGNEGVVGIARLGYNSDSQIAIRNDADQLFALVVVNDRHGTDIFPPHHSGGHADGICRQTANRVFSHNFTAIHQRSLPTLKSELSSSLSWLSFVAVVSIPKAYPQCRQAYQDSLSVLSIPIWPHAGQGKDQQRIKSFQCLLGWKTGRYSLV